jgi:hypothetical protein
MKSVIIKQSNSIDDEAIIYSNNHYAEGIYVIDAEDYDNAITANNVGVSLEIVEDQTFQTLFGSNGEIEHVSSCDSDMYLRNTISSTSLNSSDIYSNEQSVTLQPQEAKVFSFTPSRTLSYTFTTSGTTNTVLSLYDNNMNLITTNDNISSINSNAKITEALVSGEKYYIRLSKYTGSGDNIQDTTSATTTFQVKYNFTSSDYTSVTFSSNSYSYNLLSLFGTFKVFSFMVSSGFSTSYTFYTTTSLPLITDTYIEILDSSFNRLYYDDDSGDYNNASIFANFIFLNNSISRIYIVVKAPALFSGSFNITRTSNNMGGGGLIPTPIEPIEPI